MKNIFKNTIFYLIGSMIGAIGGYLYYIYVGCSNGSCPITSSLTMSVIWGAMTGILLFNLLKKEKKNISNVEHV